MKYTFSQPLSQPYMENHLNLGQKLVDGSEINVSNKYFLRDGKPWIPVMGEIHFSRVPQKDWEEAILKMKAGGITAISTYVIWIYHNELEGVWDFSGQKNIRQFITLCKKHELDVVLRIGPWSHGEVRSGGFPDWLLEKNIPLRTNDEQYLAYAKTFYEKIFEQVDGLLYKDQGNILAIQLENELVNNAPHLLELKRIAKEVGLLAPLYTVTGWNSKYGAQIPENDVVPVFGGYCEAPWAGHTKQLDPSPHYFFLPIRNDSSIGEDLISSADEGKHSLPYERYPFATCELGGGIQVTHHRRPYIKGDDVSAVAMVKIGCGNNLPGYYMYHGGHNLIGELSTLNETKATGYPNDYPVISYDFQTAIGEYGQIRPQYRKLKLQHLFIKHFMHEFAKMDAAFSKTQITDRSDTSNLRYAMRTDGESGYVFVNTYQRLTDMPKCSDVQFEVSVGTDTLVFPQKPITIEGGVYFFLPFNMKLGEECLTYATAQPVCKVGNTYFFKEIDGIDSEFVFGDKSICEKNFMFGDIRIVVLTEDDALHLYEAFGTVYISKGDLYAGDEVTLYREGDVDLSYEKWEADRFVHYPLYADEKTATIKIEESSVFEHKHLKEMQIGKPKTIKTYKLEVIGEGGWIEIDYVGDAAQIYVDSVLYADDFYYGKTWRVDIENLNGREVYLAISELNDDIYLETGEKSGLELKNIKFVPCYKKAVE